MSQMKASDFDPRVLKLFDGYVHGIISRRNFLDRAAAYTVGGVTAAALLESLSPDFARGQRIAADDPGLSTAYVEYPSPAGYGTVRAYTAKPANADGPLPGVVVIHENRGLNPHIEDIARRLGLAGYFAFAPDALTPLGGYPGDEDRARGLFADLDRTKTAEDFVAAVEFLQRDEECNGNVGCTGFCFGGGISNMLAVRVPSLLAAIPYYGGQPAVEDVPRIQAAVQVHYGGLDARINAGWPAYEEALQAAGVRYEGYIYEGANHGFNNDTTPRYDEAAAALAWERTLAFFAEHLS
jgi:carboxymethylenebutenolidase